MESNKFLVVSYTFVPKYGCTVLRQDGMAKTSITTTITMRAAPPQAAMAAIAPMLSPNDGETPKSTVSGVPEEDVQSHVTVSDDEDVVQELPEVSHEEVEES